MPSRRTASKAWHHLYNSKKWKALRYSHLHSHPLCVMCKDQGQLTQAAICDHIEPHKGDEAKFINPNNLQSLCKAHHDATKQRQERRGYEQGCDTDGIPLDPDHPWRIAAT